MNWKGYRGLVLSAVVALSCFSHVSAFTLSFTNSSEFSNDNVFVWFEAQPNYDVTLNANPITLGHSYSLTQLASGIDLTSMVSGRIYVSLGAPLPDPGRNANGTPVRDPGVLPTDDGYNVRYDFVELTNTGNAADVADLTSMDSYSVSMRVQLKKSGIAMTGSGTSAGWKGNTDQDVVTALSALVGSTGANIHTYDGKFVRVNGATKFPTAYCNTPDDPRSMTAYLTNIKQGNDKGRRLRITGRFDADTIYEYEPAINENGDIVLTKVGGSASNPEKIVVPASFKNGPNPDDPTVTLAQQIYASNPNYSVNDGPVHATVNDVTGAVARDLFAALNLGYVNSEHVIVASDTTDQSLVGKKIYELNTTELRTLTIAFSEVNDFYNIYADEIHKLSDSYGYAYSDWNENLGKVAVTPNALHDGEIADELNIEIFGSLLPTVSTPEPSTGVLLLLGAMVAFRAGRRKRC